MRGQAVSLDYFVNHELILFALQGAIN